MSTESAASGGGSVGEEFDANIGLLGAVAIGVGTMIAAGIFVLSGLAVSKVGTVAIVSFLLAALVACITAGAYAEFSSVYQESGGGYMYVDKTFDTDLTYLMGWTMILGYPASAAFYLASFSDWFAEFIYPLMGIPHGSAPYWIPGLAVLALLVGLNVKGGEESNKFQIGVTALKVALIALFLYGGLKTFQADVVTTSFAQHIGELTKIGTTSALVFITFFGFSAIATNAEEIKKPGRTIPRAIYVSIAFVVFVYTLVVLVIVLAVNDGAFKQFLAGQVPAVGAPSEAVGYIASHGEVAMAYAAQYYLGNVGFYIIIVGALFSMLSAANATILAGSRVNLALSRRGHLPSGFEELSESGTPYKAVLLTGAFILTFLVVFTIVFGRALGLFGLELGVEGVTQFANALLISGLTVVNVALIFSRRRHPDLDRGFEVPLVPYLPVVGILANLVLLYNVGWTALGIALVAELVGAALYFVLASDASEEELEAETPTATSQPTLHGRDYRLLVSIADVDDVGQLMRTAVDLVRDRDGEILVLNVVNTPRQMSLGDQRRVASQENRRLVREAMSVAEEAGVPVSGTVRYAHEPENAILNTAEQYDTGGILVGWGGDRSGRRNVVLGSTVDDVVREADADVFVEKVGDGAAEAADGHVRSVLLPIAGGPHTELAAETARVIAESTGASVHAVRVVSPADGSVADAESHLQSVADVFEGSDVHLETRVIEHDDVSAALVEAAADHDLTVVGSSREGLFEQNVFGTVPENVGDGVRAPTLMVQRDVGASSRFRRLLGSD
ncbi:amino acid permease [Halobium salinum]|uniref:Amino acid permease n=1 Tax=Halobium salinum TaxID=1364940 RepID=A0ABD5PGB5_9EURY|nr:amino acid permease [Halobium salinum]